MTGVSPQTATRIEEVGDRLLVHFPRPAWWRTASLFVWLSVWTAIGANVVSQLFVGPGGDDPFLFLWLCGWIVGEAVVIAVVAWQAFGRTLLTVTPDRLEARKQLGRFSRARTFDAALVQGVSAERVPSGDEGPERKDFGIELWYAERSVHVGEGLREDEAAEAASRVLAWIRPRVPWGDEPAAGFRQTPITAAARERPRTRAATFLRSVAFPLVVVAAIAWIVVVQRNEPPSQPPSHSRPASEVTRIRAPFPSHYSDPREYASAMTLYALASGRAQVLGAPDCGKGVSWTAWTCTVRARATIGPYAGRALAYRCTSVAQPGGRGGTLCGPARPPPVPGVVTSPA